MIRLWPAKHSGRRDFSAEKRRAVDPGVDQRAERVHHALLVRVVGDAEPAVVRFQQLHRRAAGLQQMVDDVVKTYGKIDILHNNAGVNRRVKFEDMDTKTRDFIIGVNILGVWNVARAVWPYMLKANYGRIINTSSVTGVKVVDEGQSTYALTKGAVLGFTKALAYEGGPHGITVNAVLPGWVRTPKVEQVCRDSRPEDPESAMRDMAAFIPLKRLCNIEEIGDLVAFLASDDSKYITGTEQVIDGGSTLPETFDILHA